MKLPPQIKTVNPRAPFFDDWPAEDYPQAVADCLAALRAYIPRRNRGRSWRWSAKNALEQARYLGLREIGPLPPMTTTQARRQNQPTQPVQLALCYAPPGAGGVR